MRTYGASKVNININSSTLGINLNLADTKTFDKVPVSVGHVNDALLSDANALYKKLRSNA